MVAGQRYVFLPGDGDGELLTWLRMNAGRRFAIRYGGHNIEDVQIDIPVNVTNQWYKARGRFLLFVDSANTVFDAGVQRVICDVFQQQLHGQFQVFQHHPTSNCLLLPILKGYEDLHDSQAARLVKLNGAKRVTAQYTLNKTIKKVKQCKELMALFVDGVPEDQLTRVCQELNVSMEIVYALDARDTYFVYKENPKHKLYKYTITRSNHVEITKKILGGESYAISSTDMKAMYDKLDASEDLNVKQFLYTMDSTNTVTSITSQGIQYTATSAYGDVHHEFLRETRMIDEAVSFFKDPALSKVLLSAAVWGGTVDYPRAKVVSKGFKIRTCSGAKKIHGAHFSMPDDRKTIPRNYRSGVHIYHRDMARAFANFTEMPYYQGFPGPITDLRKTDRVLALGIYMIDNIVPPTDMIQYFSTENGLDYPHLITANAKIHARPYSQTIAAHDRILKRYKNGQMYISPELEMLRDHGYTFDIVAGAYGTAPVLERGGNPEEMPNHFEFPDSMHQKYGEVRGYCRFTGMVASVKTTTQQFLNSADPAKDAAAMQRADGSANITYCTELNRVVLDVQKTDCKHRAHIAAFITGYQFIGLMDQLTYIPVQDVVRVCVDGIYHYGGHYPMRNVFRRKSEGTFRNGAGSSYNGARTPVSLDDFMAPLPHVHRLLITGPPGSGKTHESIQTPALSTIYLFPSWKLASAKKAEFPHIHVDVWANFICGGKVKAYSWVRTAFLDEASMSSEHMKALVFSLYPKIKLVFAGDIGFQAPPFGIHTDGTILVEMNKAGFDGHHHQAYVHRIVAGDPLRPLLEQMRVFIDGRIDATFVMNWIKERFPVIDDTELAATYDYKHDTILVRTNSLVERYTAMFPTDKFVSRNKHTFNGQVYGRGAIFTDVAPRKNIEKRHAFTTHSMQGETIPLGHRLFINCETNYEVRVIYTAIARAKRKDQITLVFNVREPETKRARVESDPTMVDEADSD